MWLGAHAARPHRAAGALQHGAVVRAAGRVRCAHRDRATQGMGRSPIRPWHAGSPRNSAQRNPRSWRASARHSSRHPSKVMLDAAPRCAISDEREQPGANRGPTLVIGGTYDPAPTIEASRELADAIPGAQFAELPAAHLSNLGAAAQFNERCWNSWQRIDAQRARVRRRRQRRFPTTHASMALCRTADGVEAIWRKPSRLAPATQRRAPPARRPCSSSLGKSSTSMISMTLRS